MGLQLPSAQACPAARHCAVALAVTMALLVLLPAVPSRHATRLADLAMPDPRDRAGAYIYDLWQWSWVAALVIGVIVWGLIF